MLNIQLKNDKIDGGGRLEVTEEFHDKSMASDICILGSLMLNDLPCLMRLY